MPFITNMKIKSFEYTSRFLKNLGANALEKAQEIDRKSKPEYNVVAIPFIKNVKSNEDYKAMWESLYEGDPIVNFGVPNVEKNSKKIKFESGKTQFVIGNFNDVNEILGQYDKHAFNHYGNKVLKTTNGYVLQELSRNMDDGIFLDGMKDEKIHELENIAINTVGGGRIINPTLLVFRNGREFIYRDPSTNDEESSAFSNYFGYPTSQHIHETIKLCYDLFKVNTVAALNIYINSSQKRS